MPGLTPCVARQGYQVTLQTATRPHATRPAFSKQNLSISPRFFGPRWETPPIPPDPGRFLTKRSTRPADWPRADILPGGRRRRNPDRSRSRGSPLTGTPRIVRGFQVAPRTRLEPATSRLTASPLADLGGARITHPSPPAIQYLARVLRSGLQADSVDSVGAHGPPDRLARGRPLRSRAPGCSACQ